MSVIIETTKMVRELTESLQSSLPDFGSDRWKEIELGQLAMIQKAIKGLKESTDTLAKEVNKIHDYVRKEALPDKMAEVHEGTESVRLEGVGLISLRTDIYASICAGMQEPVKDWLFETGNEGLLKETVNSSSLKAFLKKCISEGMEVPEDLFNVTPYTYAVVLK